MALARRRSDVPIIIIAGSAGLMAQRRRVRARSVSANAVSPGPTAAPFAAATDA